MDDKIIIVTPTPFPYGNASVNRMLTFCKGFHYNNVKSEIWCLFPNLNLAYSIDPIGEYNGIPYKYLSNRVHKTKIKIYNLYLRFKSIYIGYKLIKKELKCSDKIVVIYIGQPNFFLFLFSFFASILKVNIYLEVCEYPFLLKNKKFLRIKYFFLKIFLKFVDGFIYETERLESFYKERLKINKRYLVLPSTMFFEDIISSTKTSKNTKYIAYCGSIYSEDKDGLSLILNSFAKVSKENKNLNLYFVGRISNNKYFENLVKLTEDLKVTDKVVFTGEVNRIQYVDYLTNAYLLVVAKGKDSFFSGGLSSKVVEYLFSKNPVLLLKSDDYYKYLQNSNAAFFIEEGNINTISEAFSTILNNPIEAKKVGENGYSYALKYFNYIILTKNLYSFIKKI